MPLTNRVTEEATVVGVIAASGGSAGTQLSEAISLASSTARRLVAYLNVGTIGSSATVDAHFKWAATSGGSYTTITSTAITQDTTGSKVHQVELLVEKLIADQPTAKYVKFEVTVGTASTPYAATVVGFDSPYLPVTAGADVGQTVVYP